MDKNNLDPTHFYNNGKVKEVKKQESWFHTDVNFENSFKYWFALQWQNKNIQIFVVGLVLLILQICNFGTTIEWFLEAWDNGILPGLMVSMGMLIPMGITSIVAYKGFYQHFNDLKNGTSR